MHPPPQNRGCLAFNAHKAAGLDSIGHLQTACFAKP
jgi:hypothetical protein